MRLALACCAWQWWCPNSRNRLSLNPNSKREEPKNKPFAKPESVCDSRAPPQAPPTLATDGTRFSRGRSSTSLPASLVSMLTVSYAFHDGRLTAQKSRAFSDFRASSIATKHRCGERFFQNFRVHLEDAVLPLLLLLLRRNESLDPLLVTRVTGGHGGVESVAG